VYAAQPASKAKTSVTMMVICFCVFIASVLPPSSPYSPC
jgi:hypothetical protein